MCASTCPLDSECMSQYPELHIIKSDLSTQATWMFGLVHGKPLDMEHLAIFLT